jgi:Ca-activated chloride channel family protein
LSRRSAASHPVVPARGTGRRGTGRGRALPLFLILVTILAASCTSSDGIGDGSNDGELSLGDFSCDDSDADTLAVLAGSELQDLEPFFDEIAAETQVCLEPTYTGTLNGTETIVAGTDHDLAWFSHSKYLDLLTEGSSTIAASTPTMLSPVTIGVRRSLAERLGWTDGEVSWTDLESAATSGDLRFAMTNPVSSNSGFTALVAVATALADTGAALTDDDVATVDVNGFFTGQALTGGSSGWLAETFAAEGSDLGAMINYESVLLGMDDDLVVLHPSEGLITADYPLVLLNEDAREAYDRLVDLLLDPDFQTRMSEATLRRPVVPEATVAAAIPDANYAEIPFPASQSTIDTLLFAYLDEARPPATTIYLLDTSGSMDGQPMEDLKAALMGFTGLDESLTGRFSRFRQGERILLVPFSAIVSQPATFEVDDVASSSATFEEMRAYIDGLRAAGDTALFDALAFAHEQVIALRQDDPSRYYTVVLLSDGAATSGRDFDGFAGVLPTGADGSSEITRTFPILFGDADADAMARVADTTGGRVFDSEGNLQAAFKAIRGYQ